MHHNTKFTSFLKVKKCMHGRSVQFIPDSQIDVWYLVPKIYLFFSHKHVENVLLLGAVQKTTIIFNVFRYSYT